MPSLLLDFHQIHQSILSFSLSPWYAHTFVCPVDKLFYFVLKIFCSKNVAINFARRTDVMPPIPLETKYHPSAVDLLLIKRLIGETSKPNLLQFLQHEFVNISKAHAERLIGKNRLLRTCLKFKEQI